MLLDALEEAPESAKHLDETRYLRDVWALHYVREEDPEDPRKATYTVRQSTFKEKPAVGKRPESPYDPAVRYMNKGRVHWVGYKVHLSESCDEHLPHFLTHVLTTDAAFHDQHSAPLIHEALKKKDLLPRRHLVDSGYVSTKTIVESLRQYQVHVLGPAMKNTSWQNRKKAAFSNDDFTLDWAKGEATCPAGKKSKSWGKFETKKMGRFVRVQFRKEDCQACIKRKQCTTGRNHGRQLTLKRKEEYDALQEIRREMKGEKGVSNRNKRSGIEGTISQAVRGFGMRRSRYRSLAKTALQHFATAAALNMDRFVAFKMGRPLAQTRTPQFVKIMTSA